MAYNDWDAVIESYKQYIDSHYSEHAIGIIKLIPKIQLELKDIEFDFGDSHSTLFLELPQCIISINIWCEGNNQYTIYLEHPDKGKLEETNVYFDEVTEMIRHYFKRLENDADSVNHESKE